MDQVLVGPSGAYAIGTKWSATSCDCGSAGHG